MGIFDDGPDNPQAAEWRAASEKARETLDPEYCRGKYRDTLVENGMNRELASRIAGIGDFS